MPEARGDPLVSEVILSSELLSLSNATNYSIAASRAM